MDCFPVTFTTANYKRLSNPDDEEMRDLLRSTRMKIVQVVQEALAKHWSCAIFHISDDGKVQLCGGIVQARNLAVNESLPTTLSAVSRRDFFMKRLADELYERFSSNFQVLQHGMPMCEPYKPESFGRCYSVFCIDFP